jgi:hypothetical protein
MLHNAVFPLFYMLGFCGPFRSGNGTFVRSKQNRGAIGKLAAGDAGIIGLTLAYTKHKASSPFLSRFA